MRLSAVQFNGLHVVRQIFFPYTLFRLLSDLNFSLNVTLHGCVLDMMMHSLPFIWSHKKLEKPDYGFTYLINNQVPQQKLTQFSLDPLT